MQNILIKDARILKDDKTLNVYDLLIEDNIIKKIEKNIEHTNEYLIDAKNNILSPGLIDIHTHGALNHDCIEDKEEAHKQISYFHAINGTTSYCPTFVASSLDTMESAIKSLMKAKDKNVMTSRNLGVHIEGTFCSHYNKGAQDPKYLLKLTDEVKEFFRNNSKYIKRITLAPDISDSAIITKFINDLGIQVSLGHDNSYDEEIYSCIKNGASSTTHLFNCTSSLKRINGIKRLGLAEITLIEDAMYTEIIADDRHIPNQLLNLIFKAKNKDKIIPVSDSISLTGLKEDETSYMNIVEKTRPIGFLNGVGVLLEENNTCAGSVTCVINILKNIKKYLKFDIATTLRLGFESARNLLKLNKLGKIEVGYLADLIIVDEHLNLLTSICDGKIVLDKLKK